MTSYWTCPEGPWIHIGDLEFEVVAERARRFETTRPDSVARVLRGRDMHFEGHIVRAIAAAFQFPEDAVRTSDIRVLLDDLSWLPAARYALVITECSALLRDPRLLSGVSRVLQDVGSAWSNWPYRESRPFHTVLLARSSVLPNIEDILVEAGVGFDCSGADVFAEG